MKNKTKNGGETVRITFGQLLLSAFSAIIGIQSNANRARDFKHGKISHIILIGLLFGMVFVFTIVGVVKIVLSLAGA